jgi:hypothetical protein
MWLQDYDTGSLFGRKPEYLAEIMIERDERALLHDTDLKERLILAALKLLVTNGSRIVTGRSQKLQATKADILVKLELHVTLSGYTSQRDRDDLFPGSFGPVGNRGQDIIMLQLRIIGEQLGLGHSIRQEIEEERYPDASALDARLAAANLRID